MTGQDRQQQIEARTLAELEPAAMRCYERVKTILPRCSDHAAYTKGCEPCEADCSLDTLAAMLHSAYSGWDALAARLSGLRDTLAKKDEALRAAHGCLAGSRIDVDAAEAILAAALAPNTDGEATER